MSRVEWALREEAQHPLAMPVSFLWLQVNKSKGLKAMEEKRKKRGQVDTKAEEFAKIRRTFVQRDAVKDAGAQATPLLSKDVLSKVSIIRKRVVYMHVMYTVLFTLYTV